MIEQNKKQSKPIQINVYLESFTGRKNVRVYYSGALSRPRQGRLKIWMEHSILFVTTYNSIKNFFWAQNKFEFDVNFFPKEGSFGLP